HAGTVPFERERSRGQRLALTAARLEPERVWVAAEDIGEQQPTIEATVAAERRAGRQRENGAAGAGRHTGLARGGAGPREAEQQPHQRQDDAGGTRHRHRSTTRAASSARASALDFSRRSACQQRTRRRVSVARGPAAAPRAMASTTGAGLRTARAI